jgi:RNA polymerase sigma factor (sigma-70 family)
VNGKAGASYSDVKGEIVELIPALRAFARSLCRNHADADDLVQETLVRAISRIETFEPGTRLKSWLFTIMRNAFCTRLAKDRRQPLGQVDCTSSRAVQESPQEWHASLVDLHAALTRLPPHQHEVLVLIGVLGESYEDTAAICGCAVGTVKSRLSRARAALMQTFGEAPSPRPQMAVGR